MYDRCLGMDKFRNGLVIQRILYLAYDYLSMLGLKLIHDSKRGPRRFKNDKTTKILSN